MRRRCQKEDAVASTAVGDSIDRRGPCPRLLPTAAISRVEKTQEGDATQSAGQGALPSSSVSHAEALDHGEKFEKVKSLRFGGNDIWSQKSGRYRVEGSEMLEGSGRFFFHVMRTNRAGTISLVCKSKKATRCSVSAKIPTDGKIDVTGVHNHCPDEAGYGKEYRQKRTEWLDDIRENPTKKPADVIVHHRRLLPRATADRIIQVNHMRTCRYHAAKVRPGRIRSLKQLHKKMKTECHPGFNVTIDGEALLSSFNKKRNILVLTTPTLLSMVSDATMLQADATYKIVPRRICRQLFTLHGNWEGDKGTYVGMFACAFMNSSDAKSYRWVFRCLTRTMPGLTVSAYMGDWDKAMRKAVRKEFRDCRIYGCIFHYSQALVKKASDRSVGMATAIRKPGEVLSNFLAFTALPLLPSHMILPAFYKLSARARESHAGFPIFIDYVLSFWLTEIGPESLSVFGLNHRTNNHVEANNSKLQRKAGVHGSVWSLVSVIAGFAQDVAVNKRQHDRGVEHILSKPRKATRLNKLRVTTSWAMLSAEELSDIEFLDRVKYKVGKVNHLRCVKKDRRRHYIDPSLRAWIKAGSCRDPEEDPDCESTPTLPAYEGVLRDPDEAQPASEDIWSETSDENPDAEATVSASEGESCDPGEPQSDSEDTWSAASDEKHDANTAAAESGRESSDPEEPQSNSEDTFSVTSKENCDAKVIVPAAEGLPLCGSEHSAESAPPTDLQWSAATQDVIAAPKVSEIHTNAQQLKRPRLLASSANQRWKPASSQLSDYMCFVIKQALKKRPDEVVVDAQVSGLTVYCRDLKTLTGHEWLNDVIINVYLNLIVHRSRHNPALPKVFALNTYFLMVYERMGYDEVRRWTKGQDIFSYDILLAPIHMRNHWTMAIVDFRVRQIKYLDSMAGHNDDCLRMLLGYLANESKDKRNCPLNLDEWQLVHPRNLPHQLNCADCGVFALKYAEYASRDAPMDFSQSDMSYFRQEIMVEILQSQIFSKCHSSRFISEQKASTRASA